MKDSIGLVIPAYKPDMDQLTEYIHSIHDEFDNIRIRIELDSGESNANNPFRSLPVTVNRVPSRRGKGAAITEGFENLPTDVLAFADADGATPAKEVKSVLNPVLTGAADLSAGSRRHPDATVQTHQTYARRYMGDAFAWFARSLLEQKLYDYQCGIKSMSAEAWEKIRSHLHEPGFAWDIELIGIAGAHNLQIEEVPINWHDKPGSTVSPVTTSLDLVRAVLFARYRSAQLSGNRLCNILSSICNDSAPLIDNR